VSSWFSETWNSLLHKPTHFFIMQIKALYRGFSPSENTHTYTHNMVALYRTQMAVSPNPAYSLLSSGNLSLCCWWKHLFHESVGGATKLTGLMLRPDAHCIKPLCLCLHVMPQQKHNRVKKVLCRQTLF